MSPAHLRCGECSGIGWILVPETWYLCPSCDGRGYVWGPGAPGYGCKIVLSERHVGEIVTLGNGDRGRIVRHSPRKDPTTTYLCLINDFSEEEDYRPTGYPSEVGVRSVGVARYSVDDGRDERGQDMVDPLRGRSSRLI